MVRAVLHLLAAVVLKALVFSAAPVLLAAQVPVAHLVHQVAVLVLAIPVLAVQVLVAVVVGLAAALPRRRGGETGNQRRG